MPSIDICFRDAFVISKSDTLPLPTRVDAIYVGGTGDVAVLTEGGNTVTFKAIPAGGLLPFSTEKVLSTGTSATDMMGLLYNVTYGAAGGTGGGAVIDPFIFDDSGNPLLDDSGNQLTL